jgi:hypothetical protein
MSSSTAARKVLTKYLHRIFSYFLQKIFIIFKIDTGMPYNLLLFTKAFCMWKLSCAEIEVYHTVRHHHAALSSAEAYMKFLVREK